MTAAESLIHEVEIVWLEDVSGLEYVREAVQLVRRRRGRPAFNPGPGGRLVGYANVGPTAKGHNWHFQRRVFWLQGSDPYRWPSEAVTPGTVAVKVPGRLIS